MVHDDFGEPIIYSNAGAKAMWLVFPAFVAIPVALIPLFLFYWYVALVLAIMIFSLILNHLGVRGKDLVRGFKMLLIGGRRQLQSRRVVQRNIRGLRG
ncbi:hypothetical protein N9L75_03820 [Porticoccaceae bacterium]|jgi:hypothetical protein|nr:hypothetical protein [Porticoccaceae bacterium]MDA8663429.1 hypothetical protein [Porticoccaceae bacterium]MDA8682067.1 hypothetical protein [Porticoccaceae bacterium]MDB2343085.1 hypothetical protein [Porticoccaceae bacterium]MDB2486954.1 hypothetical protein [Porticoccaceae bacterium]